jgi:hypothetical protein
LAASPRSEKHNSISNPAPDVSSSLRMRNLHLRKNIDQKGKEIIVLYSDVGRSAG